MKQKLPNFSFFFIMNLLCLLVGCAHSKQNMAPTIKPAIYENTTGAVSALKSVQDQGVQIIQTGNHLRLILFSDKFFANNTNQIMPDHTKALAIIADILKRYRISSIVVAGYSDQVGGEVSQLQISYLQAQAVAAYLWSQGIPLNAVKVISFGTNHSIASNETVDGSAFNRRVEIIADLQS